jgi:hypothetical protein
MIATSINKKKIGIKPLLVAQLTKLPKTAGKMLGGTKWYRDACHHVIALLVFCLVDNLF